MEPDLDSRTSTRGQASVRKVRYEQQGARRRDTNLLHSRISPERAILGILQLIKLDVAPEGMRSTSFIALGEIQQSSDIGMEGVALRRVVEIDGYAEVSGRSRRKGEGESFLAKGKS